MYFWGALVVGFPAVSESLWVLRVGGCGLFGLGSFAAGGLGWGAAASASLV